MINNFDIIRQFLQQRDDSYFHVQLMLRRKDGHDVNGCKVIRHVFVKSLSEFDENIPEWNDVCERENARCYINPSAKLFKGAAMIMLKELVNKIAEESYVGLDALYKSCAAKNPQIDKIWIIDYDFDCGLDLDDVRKKINKALPVGDKILLEVPTVNGTHLLTTPFDMRCGLPSEMVKKNAQTLLYAK